MVWIFHRAFNTLLALERRTALEFYLVANSGCRLALWQEGFRPELPWAGYGYQVTSEDTQDSFNGIFVFSSEAQDNQRWPVLSFIAFLTPDGITKHHHYFPVTFPWDHSRWHLGSLSLLLRIVWFRAHAVQEAGCLNPTECLSGQLRVLGWNLGNFRILWT